MPLVEEVVALVVLGIVIWQLIVPVIFGLPLFPLVRRRKSAGGLVRQIDEARADLAEDKLREELQSLMKQHRGPSHEDPEPRPGAESIGKDEDPK